MVDLDCIVKEAKASGLEFQMINGGKHIKLLVAGEFCAIWPKSGKETNRRGALNILCQVRRCIKKHKDA
jgi:hypothetical protein